MNIYQEATAKLEKRKYEIYKSFIEGNTSLEDYIQNIESIDEEIRIIQKSEKWLNKPERGFKTKKKKSFAWFKRLIFLTTTIIIMLSIVVWASNQKPNIQEIQQPVQEVVITTPETLVVLETDVDLDVAPEKTEWKSLGIFTTSAYCKEDYPHICNDGNPHTTALGTTPTVGRTIAVDPSVIPYGTEVMINDHIYIAEDCGEAIKGNRIDILYETHNEAYCHGMQQVEVFIKNN